MNKNPFLSGVTLTLFNKQKITNLYEQGDINKVTSSLSQQIEWEKDPYIKVYTGNTITNLYKDLNPISCKLVLYIQLNLKPQVDMIELDVNKCMEFLGIESKTTYYKYLQELIDNAIVSRHRVNSYWVNPMLIFNGNRIEYYREVCPECIQVINLTEIQESKAIKKKKDLMNHFKCNNYYQLKILLGSEQIEKLLSNKITLSEVVLLKGN